MSAPTVEVGTKLPGLSLYGDPTFIVSTAIATRDYQDVHHDRDLAQGHGSRDIFVNILATTGLVQKYVGDWARDAIGPEFVVRSCALRLGAPAHPYDTLSFSGEVTDETDGVLTIDVVGRVVTKGLTNGMDHVTAKVAIAR
jgi:MaoC like domain